MSRENNRSKNQVSVNLSWVKHSAMQFVFVYIFTLLCLFCSLWANLLHVLLVTKYCPRVTSRATKAELTANMQGLWIACDFSFLFYAVIMKVFRVLSVWKWVWLLMITGYWVSSILQRLSCFYYSHIIKYRIMRAVTSRGKVRKSRRKRTVLWVLF